MTAGERPIHAAIARCPEHGLHGARYECFECGGPVEQVEMVEMTWLGLLLILDAWYPESVFTGASGDPGPALIATIRDLSRLRHAARQVVDALNFHDATLTGAYRAEQRAHLLDACRQLREVLGDA